MSSPEKSENPQSYCKVYNTRRQFVVNKLMQMYPCLQEDLGRRENTPIRLGLQMTRRHRQSRVSVDVSLFLPVSTM